MMRLASIDLFANSMWGFNLLMATVSSAICVWIAVSRRFHTGILATMGLAMMAIACAAYVGWQVDGLTCDDLPYLVRARALFNGGLLLVLISWASNRFRCEWMNRSDSVEG